MSKKKYMLRTQKILSTSHVASECFGVLLLHGILGIYHFIFLSHIHTNFSKSFPQSPPLSPSLSLSRFLILSFTLMPQHSLLLPVARCKLNFQQKTLSSTSTVSHCLSANSLVVVLAMCVLHTKTARKLENKERKTGSPACISLVEIERQQRKQYEYLS